MADQCCRMVRAVLPGCLCRDGCECMCPDCGCEEWGEEYGDE